MYRILITTFYSGPSGCALVQNVVEFDHEPAAEQAVDAIHGAPQMAWGPSHVAIRLYKPSYDNPRGVTHAT